MKINIYEDLKKMIFNTKYIGFILSLFSLACSVTLPDNAKKNANKDNNTILGIASILPKPSTSYVIVPNSDTTMPLISVLSHDSGLNTLKSNITLDSNVGDITGTVNNHIYANLTNANKVAVMNIDSNGVRFIKYINAGSRPVHIYLDPDGKIWSMNDGNSGVDNINSACNNAGVSSVTIIQDGASGASDTDYASLIKHLCVGKGHHKAIFTTSPKRAFVSSITDNTVSVIDNEPLNSTYLTVLATLSLGTGAGPHGFSYSSVSGKVYISAQTAGTVIAVNPSSLAMETISTPKSGPSTSSPNGLYIALPGKDTTSDSNHVIGKVTILNASTHVFSTVSITDVSPDHMMFNSDGTRLYVASAQAGSGNQVTNLNQSVLLVYDSSNLPSLNLIAQIPVGACKSGNRHINAASHGSMMHIFNPAGDGILYTVDSMSNSVTQKINLGGSFNNAYYHTLGAAPSHSH
ncbi:MAG TPA: hypothetical protein PKL30_12870 [Leptospiraceae bacterium]|nr:hypothetical protein [Leptospiraceae bacterium]HNC57902.1 hypothetical protein [Leptospiraceae bacterium]HNF56984.1 hypothetical protein [Leptospiraceae bacterium]HNH57167.1 hypothetical protein [Leptospiraceae bacterium]HNL73074.1 hypothetical protein [Leptospiraceae bacterium]